MKTKYNYTVDSYAILFFFFLKKAVTLHLYSLYNSVTLRFMKKNTLQIFFKEYFAKYLNSLGGKYTPNINGRQRFLIEKFWNQVHSQILLHASVPH